MVRENDSFHLIGFKMKVKEDKLARKSDKICHLRCFNFSEENLTS